MPFLQTRKLKVSSGDEFAAFVKLWMQLGNGFLCRYYWQPLIPWACQKSMFLKIFVLPVLSELDSSIDAVYLCQHGAMVAEHLHDPDGELVKRLRRKLGWHIPLVMTLDLHANISSDLCKSVNFICGYRTNPHVDMADRGRETAFALRRIMAGQVNPKIAHVKLPLTPSSLSLLTASGPFGEIIDFGQRQQAELECAIMNVSVFGNFIFSDVPDNGVSVVVTAAENYEMALRLW